MDERKVGGDGYYELKMEAELENNAKNRLHIVNRVSFVRFR
jgi:hypothetical protein